MFKELGLLCYVIICFRYHFNKNNVSLPEDMKNGMRNLPERTRSLKAGKVAASKGRAPHTKTYSTTPRD